jgi:hypothetical protein
VQAGGGSPSSVTKTEFSTFTYFITSLSGLSTVTSTDIVISSNVIGRHFKARLEPVTPWLRPVFQLSYALKQCILHRLHYKTDLLRASFSFMRKQILFRERQKLHIFYYFHILL